MTVMPLSFRALDEKNVAGVVDYPASPFEIAAMKADIHPQYNEIKVTCSCGNEFETRSTLTENLSIEVCSACHPFYTGKQKIVDSAGRVDKFRKKYNMG